MGINQNQVYYDQAKGQYYTQRNPIDNFSPLRNYLNQPSFNQNPTPSSNISNLVQQALSAQANVPSLAQLFPYMSYGQDQGSGMNGMGGLLSGTGQFGAGRFLSSNVMGNPSLTTT